jgi:hypothetical protein
MLGNQTGHIYNCYCIIFRMRPNFLRSAKNYISFIYYLKSWREIFYHFFFSKRKNLILFFGEKYCLLCNKASLSECHLEKLTLFNKEGCSEIVSNF